MIGDDKQFMLLSQINGVALKPSAFARSVSSCSIEDDFLPTFESEDYDWRHFGWLLDQKDIVLPCIEEHVKTAKFEAEPQIKCADSKEQSPDVRCFNEDSDAVGASSNHCEETIDLTEFYLSDIDENSNSSRFEHEDFIAYHEGIALSSTTKTEFEPTVESAKDDLEEPIAMRTRYGSLQLEKSSDSSQSCVSQTVPDPVYKNKSKRRRRSKHSESVISNSGILSKDDEPIAKRTRHTLPRVNFEGKGVIADDWCPVADNTDQKKPTQLKKSPKKRKYTKRLYCICETPYDRMRLYVGCDRCNGWFHPACLGITDSEAFAAEKFFCPQCYNQEMSLTIDEL